MKREGWQEDLFHYLETYKESFEFGVSDCFLFAAKAVEIQTGIDIAEPYQSQYQTEKGALRVMKKLGLNSFTEVVDQHFKLIPPLMAQRGDLISFDHPGPFQRALAVCVGEYAVGLHPEKGIYPIQMSDWVTAWRIEVTQ